MKHIGILTGLFIFSATCAEKLPYNVSIDPMWYELDAKTNIQKHSGEKWVVVGKITLKHTTKETIRLNTLSINWQGKPLNHLFGSLYKADATDTFLPIESYLVADSLWHKNTQNMHFNCEKPIMLDPITTFYIVLTIAEDIESCIKSGTFTIAQESLPREFQRFTQNNSDCLKFSIKTARSYNPLKVVSAYS
jgi:hypothetical protein